MSRVRENRTPGSMRRGLETEETSPTMATGVARPTGKPAEDKALGPTVETSHRASPRPYRPGARSDALVAEWCLPPALIGLQGLAGTDVAGHLLGEAGLARQATGELGTRLFSACRVCDSDHHADHDHAPCREPDVELPRSI